MGEVRSVITCFDCGKVLMQTQYFCPDCKTSIRVHTNVEQGCDEQEVGQQSQIQSRVGEDLWKSSK
jgi:uncharacterized Zn finger protein (UPF0148 family)